MSGFALHLLRHGAPALTGTLLGRTDSAATPDGVAACVAQTAALHIERLVTSDLHRARAAAAAIAAPRSLSPVIDPRWRELDFGEWDGRAPDTIDPDALALFHADPDAHSPPGGERWSALVARVSAATAALPPVPTLIVTHGGAMRAALHLLCGFDRDQAWAFDLPYAALLSLRVWPVSPPVAQVMGLRS